MKKIFLVEIDDSDYVDPVNESTFEAALRAGFYEAGLGNVSIVSVKEKTQSVDNEQTKRVVENGKENAKSPLSMKGIAWDRAYESED